MFRIDHSTAAVALPAPGEAGDPGYFTGGDPAGGVPATVVTADWANAMQEEICKVIEAAGIELDKDSRVQLFNALQTLGLRIATQAEVDAGTADDRMVTPKKLVNGLTASGIETGYIKLPTWLGSILIQWGRVLKTTTSSPISITFPVAFTADPFVVVASLLGAANPNGTSLSAGSATATGFDAWTTSGAAGVAVGYIAIGV